MNYSAKNPENHHQAAVDYSAYYQQQQQQQQQAYDPSSHQYYHQPAIDYHNSYAYQPYGYSIQPDPNSTVETHHHQEQEPNPPGVSAQQQPLNAYYPYHPAAVAPVQDVATPYQPIVQSSYGCIGRTDGPHPQEIAAAHSGSHPNAFVRPFRGRGRGSGRGRGGRGPGRTLHNHSTGPFPQHGPQYSTSMGSVSSMPFPVQPHSVRNAPKVFRCELCVVDCDTPEMLELHQSGKKHHKNLKRQEESQFSQQRQMEHASTSVYPVPVPVQVQSHSVESNPQKVSCELCKVDCNTLEILQQHKNGKKHMKNVKVHELLQKHNKKSTISVQFKEPPTSELSLPIQAVNEASEVAVEKPNVEPTEESGKKVEDAEPTEGSAKKIEEVVEPAEESGLKMRMDHSEDSRRGFKRKLRGGKVNNRRMKTSNGSRRPPEPPAEAVPLICELCNVKCESQVVFQSHLVGKKHLSKAKRLLGDPEILGQEILKAISPAIQALYQQNYYNHNATSNVPLQFQGFGSFQVPPPVQNWETVNVHAPSIGTSMVNTERKSVEAHSESQVETSHPLPVSSLSIAQVNGVSSGTEPLTSGTAMDGAYVPEENVFLPTINGPDCTTGQVMSEGGDSAK